MEAPSSNWVEGFHPQPGAIHPQARQPPKPSPTMRRRLQATQAAVRSNPWALILPALLFLLSSALVVWGMVALKKSLEDSAQDRAQYQTEAVGVWMTLQLKSVFEPTVLLGTLVLNNPMWGPALNQSFQRMAGQAANLLEDRLMLREFEIAPFGQVAATYPYDPPSLRLDFMATPLRRPTWEQQISSGQFVLQGPMALLEDPGVQVLVARSMIYVPGVSESETFGIPWAVTGGCNVKGCYDPATGTKWWGAALSIFNLTNLLHGPNSALENLRRMGYKYRLWRAPVLSDSPGSPAQIDIASTSELPTMSGHANVRINLNYTNFGQWVLEAEPSDGFVPWWWGLTLALLLLAAALLAVMLATAMIGNTQHQAMLYSLLPEEVVHRMKVDESYVFSNTRAKARAGTLAEMLLNFLDKVISGSLPDPGDAVYLRAAVVASTNIYVAVDLKEQLQQLDIESDVAQALLRELGGDPRRMTWAFDPSVRNGRLGTVSRVPRSQIISGTGAGGLGSTLGPGLGVGLGSMAAQGGASAFVPGSNGSISIVGSSMFGRISTPRVAGQQCVTGAAQPESESLDFQNINDALTQLVLGMDDVATTAAAPTPERIGSTSALDGLQLPLPPLLQAHQFSSANPLMMMGHGNSLLSSRTVSMPAAGHESWEYSSAGGSTVGALQTQQLLIPAPSMDTVGGVSTRESASARNLSALPSRSTRGSHSTGVSTPASAATAGPTVYARAGTAATYPARPLSNISILEDVPSLGGGTAAVHGAGLGGTSGGGGAVLHVQERGIVGSLALSRGSPQPSGGGGSVRDPKEHKEGASPPPRRSAGGTTGVTLGGIRFASPLVLLMGQGQSAPPGQLSPGATSPVMSPSGSTPIAVPNVAIQQGPGGTPQGGLLQLSPKTPPAAGSPVLLVNDGGTSSPAGTASPGDRSRRASALMVVSLHEPPPPGIPLPGTAGSPGAGTEVSGTRSARGTTGGAASPLGTAPPSPKGTTGGGGADPGGARMRHGTGSVGGGMAGSDGGVTPGHSYLNTAGSRKGSASMLAQLGTASLPSRKGSMEEVKMAAGVQLTQAELAASEQLPAPEAPLISDLEAFLAESADAWTFDAFRLEELSGGHALSVLGYYLLHKTGLLEAHKIRGIKAARLMRAIESGYQPNPYHNKTHAADVLQTMHVLLLRSGMVGAYADPLTHLACLLAASAHDLEHVGLTNDFLINTDDELAVIYNDRSPMEQHHCACLFRLLRRSDLDITHQMPRADRERLRKTMIELVLATDMKQHVTITSHFSTVHAKALSEPSPTSCPPTPAVSTGTATQQQQAQGSQPSSPSPAALALRASAKLFSGSGNTYGRLSVLGPSTPTAAKSGGLLMSRASHDGDRATIGATPSVEAALHEKEPTKGSGRVIGRLSLQHSRGPESTSGTLELAGVTVHTPGPHLRVTHGDTALPPLAPAAVPAAGSGPLPGSSTSVRDVHRTSFSGVHPGGAPRGLNVAGPALAFSRRLLMRSPSTTGTGGGTTAAAQAALTASLQSNTQGGPHSDGAAAEHSAAEASGDRSGSQGGSTVTAMAGVPGAVQVHVSDGGSGRPKKPLDDNERMLSLQIALKVADIGMIAESREVNIRWVACLEEEFFNQGDREKAAGIPVSPLFDRDKPGVSKSQPGFYTFVAIPMFRNFTTVFPGTRPLMDYLMDNLKYWQELYPSPPGASK